MTSQELLAEGTKYFQQEDYENAQRYYLQSIEADATNAVAYTNLGVCLFVQNRLNEAAECFLAANQVNPNYVQAIYNYSHLQLLQKNYQDGFSLYRTRLHPDIRGNKPGGVAYPPLQMQKGDNLEGKVLYISHEQGLGDTINFIRYIPLFLQETNKILCYVPESMNKLFALNFAQVEFITPGNDISFDSNTPLGEAPYLFGTSYDNIPFSEGYLHVDKNDLQEFQNKHESLKTDKLKIGFVYQGSQGVEAVKNRSIELSSMLKYLEQIPNAELFCLQYERSKEDDLLLEQHNITNLGAEIKDFYDTALMIESMDVIVSIDTSFLHLVGALGKKGYALLKFHPDWRWGLGDEHTNWYESLTLLRQKTANDWEGLLRELVSRFQ